jgi:hypothetical protein
MKKTHLITAAAVASVALLILCILLCMRSCKSEPDGVDIYKHLNETLDNSDSEIDELEGLVNFICFNQFKGYTITKDIIK